MKQTRKIMLNTKLGQMKINVHKSGAAQKRLITHTKQKQTKDKKKKNRERSTR